MRSPLDSMQGGSRRSGAGSPPAPGRGSSQARLARRGVLLAALAGAGTGCYSYAPRSSDVAPGARVRLDINDVGRVALAGGLGAGAERVEGSVVSQSDSVLQLRVSSVKYRGGVWTRWNGEPIEVHRSQVSDTRERRFSRGKTLALAAAGIGIIVALITTTDLDIFGITGKEGEPGPGPDQ